MVPKLLASVHIREVNLDDGQLGGLQRIVKRHRRVRVRRRVDNNRRATGACTLNLIHQHTLMIGLHKLNIEAVQGGALAHHQFNIVQGCVPVHLGATLPQQIQIRAVQNKNRCRHTPSVAYLPAQKRQKLCGNGELRYP